MSPELETLDQLCFDDTDSAAIRLLFENDQHFCRAILAMLHEREVLLLRADGSEVPAWQRRVLLGEPKRWGDHRLSITDCGAKRMN
jgi:hypothetical protein